MSVRLLFPTLLFEYNLLDEGLITETYLQELRADMNGMRKKDPKGRNVSNRYSGWQSNDGVNQRPAWNKIQRVIKNKLNDEVLPFLHIDRTKFQFDMGNIWANINDKGAWNSPHRHNGCFYSGAFYIQAEGDEGFITFIDKNEQVLFQFPQSPKMRETISIRPRSGSLLLFPSGLLHMVEPNPTDRDRYSIAFNTNSKYISTDMFTEPLDYGQDHKTIDDWNSFDIENEWQLKTK